MRISDWSSDVCSSDLFIAVARRIEEIDGRAARHPMAVHRHVDRDLIFADQVARVEQVVHRIQQEGDMVEPAALRLQDEGDVMRLVRSEEHTSELQSLMRISYAVFCLQKKNENKK